MYPHPRPPPSIAHCSIPTTTTALILFFVFFFLLGKAGDSWAKQPGAWAAALRTLQRGTAAGLSWNGLAGARRRPARAPAMRLCAGDEQEEAERQRAELRRSSSASRGALTEPLILRDSLRTETKQLPRGLGRETPPPQPLGRAASPKPSSAPPRSAFLPARSEAQYSVALPPAAPLSACLSWGGGVRGAAREGDEDESTSAGHRGWAWARLGATESQWAAALGRQGKAGFVGRCPVASPPRPGRGPVAAGWGKMAPSSLPATFPRLP